MRFVCFLIVLSVFFVMFVSGCITEPTGGQRDEHGCLVAAGYTWCESKAKCLRTWEEPCENETGETELANPASVYCEQEGGSIIFHETDEGTAGYCYIEEGIVCEEWEFFRSNGTQCNPI